MASLETRFLELLSENRSRILRICRVYAWTPQDRDDLYQEILFQIWRSLPNLRQGSHANTWLYRVAINTGIAFVRRARPDRKVVAVEHEQLIAQADRRKDQQHGSEQQTLLNALYDGLAKLNEIERTVMTLQLEDLSYEQIAEVMGISAGHAGVLLHRAKKKLADLMREVAV